MRRNGYFGWGLLLAALTWMGASDKAAAATSTTSFSMTTNVLTNCSVTVTSIDFGNYSGSKVSSQGKLTITCSTGARFLIGLNAGRCASATTTTRCMTGRARMTLNYSLTFDSAGTIDWGNTVSTGAGSGVGTGRPMVFTVFAHLPAAQSGAGPGAYNDTITATLTF